MSALEDFLAIRRTVGLWEARGDAEIGSVHGLGLSDFAILRSLAEAPGLRLRRVDLALRLGVTPSGVTRRLGPLERRRIVTREESGHDARATYAALTPSGLQLFKDANETMKAFAEALLGTLSERDRAVVGKLSKAAS